MTLMITDPHWNRRLLDERRATGEDRYDEVWEGVYVMAPMPNNEHQHMAGRLFNLLYALIEEADLGTVYPGANVSDQPTDWRSNFRCPDVLVFLNGNPAEDRDSHWYGGPDFAIEITSEGDRSYEKLPFYASAETTEVLIVDRQQWQLVLFRRQEDSMVEVGRSGQSDANTLSSEVVPLTWKLNSGDHGPEIEVAHHDGEQQWTIRNLG